MKRHFHANNQVIVVRRKGIFRAVLVINGRAPRQTALTNPRIAQFSLCARDGEAIHGECRIGLCKFDDIGCMPTAKVQPLVYFSKIDHVEQGTTHFTLSCLNHG